MSPYEVRYAVLPSSGIRIKVIVDASDLSMVPEARDFAIYLHGSGRAANTANSYIPKVAVFLDWASNAPLCDWRTVTMPQLARFKWSLEAPRSLHGGVPVKPRSARTINIYMTAVFEFLRYCARMDLIDHSVVNRLVEPRYLAHVPGSFSVGENNQFRYRRVKELRAKEIDTPPRTLAPGQAQTAAAAALNTRDRFLILLLDATALRIGEALGLRRSDMHLLPSSTYLGCEISGAHVHVIRRDDNSNRATAKSRRPRHVPVNEDLVLAYRDYQIERFNLMQGIGSDYVFVNLYKGVKGAPYTYSAASGLIRRLRIRTGIPNLHPHLFRHTRATQWIEDGSGRDVVQQLLGHAMPQSTAVYTHPSTQRLREAVERAYLGKTE